MKLFTQSCARCNKRVYRSKGRINEAKKFGWKTYCSRLCQAKILNKQRSLQCANSNCNKIFLRVPHDIRSANLYCSNSCAASINNTKFPKRKAIIYKCSYCRKEFKGRKIYCSRKCKDYSQTISGEELLRRIREFYKGHGRIPAKIEFLHYGAAQDRFGSWNKAIETAGYKPNPVMFANKHVARDGHECDSFAEKVIDDWLDEKNIKHKRNVKYPSNPKLTADFVTTKHWIEFFGLSGELKDYDSLKRKKEQLAKRYKLPLVALHPRDLFPKNHLAEIFKH